MLLIIDWNGETKDRLCNGGTVEIPCIDKEDGIEKGKAFLRENGLTHLNITRVRFVVRDSFLSMIAPALSPSVQSGMAKWAKEIA